MLKLRAFAKINLSLKILGKRPDGYHEIESQMQSISLHDSLILESLPHGIELSVGNSPLSRDGRNLAYRAAATFINFQEQTKRPLLWIAIELNKNIPLSAGLAGGSADAAAVLLGMNFMAQQPFSEQELLAMGAAIGSDVPFCILGGSRRVKGRGEMLGANITPPVKDQLYVLVVPAVEVSTPWAYQAWDEASPQSPVPLGLSLGAKPSPQNDLEAVVIEKYPIIGEVKDQLLALGCGFAQMSGSGSSVFGTVLDRAQGEDIALQMKKKYNHSYLVSAVAHGVASGS